MQLKSGMFSGWDVRRLKAAMGAVKDKRTYVRLEAVLGVALGSSIPVLSARLSKSCRSIYRWCTHYLQSRDPYSLQDEGRSGRPAAASAITDTCILTALRLEPTTLGYRSGSWTVALLARYLGERYGCSISAATLRRRMKQLGLRYKRPRYVYEEKDPNRTQKKGP